MRAVTKFSISGLMRIFLIVFLSGMQINLVASVADSTVKRKFITVYKTPKSAIFYHVHWNNILKPAVIIGSIEIQKDGFKFSPWSKIDGWPQDLFERKFPLNKGFREIYILYTDVKSINYKGRILLRSGAMHRMFGTHRKPWRSTYLQIKDRIDAGQPMSRRPATLITTFRSGNASVRRVRQSLVETERVAHPRCIFR